MIVELFIIIDFICYGVSCFLVVGLIFGYSYDNLIDEVIYLVFVVLYLLLDLLLVYGIGKFVVDECEWVLGLIECCVSECVLVVYLVGEIWFVGLKFKSDCCVLVLCLLIVELIELGFVLWLDYCYVECVLDVCIGLGCIGIVMVEYNLDW